METKLPAEVTFQLSRIHEPQFDLDSLGPPLSSEATRARLAEAVLDRGVPRSALQGHQISWLRTEEEALARVLRGARTPDGSSFDDCRKYLREYRRASQKLEVERQRFVRKLIDCDPVSRGREEDRKIIADYEAQARQAIPGPPGFATLQVTAGALEHWCDNILAFAIREDRLFVFEHTPQGYLLIPIERATRLFSKSQLGARKGREFLFLTSAATRSLLEYIEEGSARTKLQSNTLRKKARRYAEEDDPIVDLTLQKLAANPKLQLRPTVKEAAKAHVLGRWPDADPWEEWLAGSTGQDSNGDSSAIRRIEDEVRRRTKGLGD